jgi:predicted nucleic acid-binding protein
LVVSAAAGESPGWLIDKSALVRLGRSSHTDAWADRIERGLIRVATVTLLEVGYSARDPQDLRAGLREPPVASMPVEYATPAAEDRAVEVLTLLADHGHHRAPSVPDLLIAAIAERAGLVVLHQDKDFDLIAQITGQPTERLDG